MPIEFENNYQSVSLLDLVRLREQGYSVLKSPHVGNQHPSNLVCAALGIPLEMVSFTQGARDKNFHPHLEISNGTSDQLYNQYKWTQFASVTEWVESAVISFSPPMYYRRQLPATEYHQSSVKRVFPHTEICTDMERMAQYPALAATVLSATNIKLADSVWYRRCTIDGNVTTRSKGQLTQTELETDVFQFSNDTSGWVVPNKVHIVFDFVYQSLSSGRSTIYHLSGPQMVNYIGGIIGQLSTLYDAVRQRIPTLPLVLKVRIVPVAAARFATVPRRSAGLDAFTQVRDQLDVDVVAREFVEQFPEFTQPIESAQCLSQYDLRSAEDLLLDPWMLETPLSQVTRLYRLLQSAMISLQRTAAE